MSNPEPYDPNKPHPCEPVFSPDHCLPDCESYRRGLCIDALRKHVAEIENDCRVFIEEADSLSVAMDKLYDEVERLNAARGPIDDPPTAEPTCSEPVEPKPPEWKRCRERRRGGRGWCYQCAGIGKRIYRLLRDDGTEALCLPEQIELLDEPTVSEAEPGGER